ncbi:MAG: hypothetical protein WCL61_02740 [bacterium]
MKIPVEQKISAISLIRKSGYGQLPPNKEGIVSYARTMGSNFYPRFHVYITNNVINLHLDQKKAIYDGITAHSGEYDGETVENEVDRILGVLAELMTDDETAKEENRQKDEKEEKGFWSNIFG